MANIDIQVLETPAVNPETFSGYVRRRIFLHLIKKAFHHQTTTYEELAIEFDLPSTGNALGAALSPILSEVYHWCEERNLPHLTSIVVRKSGSDKGIPGAGFWWLAGVPNATREEKIALTKEYQDMVFKFFSGLL